MLRSLEGVGKHRDALVHMASFPQVSSEVARGLQGSDAVGAVQLPPHGEHLAAKPYRFVEALRARTTTAKEEATGGWWALVTTATVVQVPEPVSPR